MGLYCSEQIAAILEDVMRSVSGEVIDLTRPFDEQPLDSVEQMEVLRQLEQRIGRFALGDLFEARSLLVFASQYCSVDGETKHAQ